MKLGWIPVMAAAAMLSAAPGQAQQARCADGQGVLVPDLGYGRLTGSMRITDVRADGPAAGRLQEGDVLVAVDGSPIDTRAGRLRYEAIEPGERVRLTVRRDAQVQEVTVTAMARCMILPPEPPAAPAAPAAPAPPTPPVPPSPPMYEIMPEGWFGFMIECRDCGQDESTGVFRFREPPVVVSVEPGSPAARAGLRPGDRLTHVDGISLTSRVGWPRFYAIQPGEEVRFTYTRNGHTHQATLTAARS